MVPRAENPPHPASGCARLGGRPALAGRRSATGRRAILTSTEAVRGSLRRDARIIGLDRQREASHGDADPGRRRLRRALGNLAHRHPDLLRFGDGRELRGAARPRHRCADGVPYAGPIRTQASVSQPRWEPAGGSKRSRCEAAPPVRVERRPVASRDEGWVDSAREAYDCLSPRLGAPPLSSNGRERAAEAPQQSLLSGADGPLSAPGEAARGRRGRRSSRSPGAVSRPRRPPAARRGSPGRDRSRAPSARFFARRSPRPPRSRPC
jgi:hypothetical protein